MTTLRAPDSRTVAMVRFIALAQAAQFCGVGAGCGSLRSS